MLRFVFGAITGFLTWHFYIAYREIVAEQEQKKRDEREIEDAIDKVWLLGLLPEEDGLP